jgi:Uma2 family endonuclease
MSKTTITVGPLDHGRRMSLEDFDKAEGQEGHLYELSRGVILVSDVPGPEHFAQVNAIRRQLVAYDLTHPGRIYGIAGGGECKILLAQLDSERHPDLAIYKTSPPEDRDELWSTWIPEIVVEVVSPSSRDRDYVEKREEYFAFGVMEYWIFDAERGELLVLRRVGGRWVERTVRPPDEYRTRLLPGFALATGPVFQAAADV